MSKVKFTIDHQSLKNTIIVLTDKKNYRFEYSNTHIGNLGIHPKPIERIAYQRWLKLMGHNQLLKKYNWCKHNNLDWKKEFKKSRFILSNRCLCGYDPNKK